MKKLSNLSDKEKQNASVAGSGVAGVGLGVAGTMAFTPGEASAQETESKADSEDDEAKAVEVEEEAKTTASAGAEEPAETKAGEPKAEEVVTEEVKAEEPKVEEPKAEEVKAEEPAQVSNEAQAVGVVTVADTEGNEVKAVVYNEGGKVAALVDVDGDNIVDAQVIDANGDGEIQAEEVHDLSNLGVAMPGTEQQTASVETIQEPVQEPAEPQANFVAFVNDGETSVGVFEVDGQMAAAVDVDNDGTVDYIVTDADNNGEIDMNPNEVLDVAGENLSMDNFDNANDFNNMVNPDDDCLA